MDNEGKNRPAYPVPEGSKYHGMTLREYLASLAMQGFCANRSMTHETGPGQLARMALNQADALLEELNKK